MKWFLVCVVMISGCGLKMEDVKQEMLPMIQANNASISELQKSQQGQIVTLSEDLRHLETHVSTLHDRLQSLQIEVAKSLNEQNVHIKKLTDMELDLLEKKSTFIKTQLELVMAQISEIQGKKSLTDERATQTPAPEVNTVNPPTQEDSRDDQQPQPDKPSDTTPQDDDGAQKTPDK